MVCVTSSTQVKPSKGTYLMRETVSELSTAFLFPIVPFPHFYNLSHVSVVRVTPHLVAALLAVHAVIHLEPLRSISYVEVPVPKIMSIVAV